MDEARIAAAARGLGPTGERPVAVEFSRGPVVESRHAVDIAVCDTDGAIVARWGMVANLVMPRSAVKPLQALPLIETGAADAFGLGDAEIALACASHGGEPVHVETVGAWLRRLGLDDGDLECGAHAPRHEDVFAAQVRSGGALCQAHNNCSGKHAGMLSHAVHRGEATAGYVERQHPAQGRVAAALGEMCGLGLSRVDHGIDGCGIPTYPIPLRALARGMARLASPDGLAADRAAACRRIAAAMIAEPYMVAGRDRCCTELLRAGAGRIVAKTGAEGVYLAGLPGTGLGLALKARDGAGRAAEIALIAVLAHLGALDAAAAAALAGYGPRPLHNVRGRIVGEGRATAWPDPDLDPDPDTAR